MVSAMKGTRPIFLTNKLVQVEAHKYFKAASISENVLMSQRGHLEGTYSLV